MKKLWPILLLMLFLGTVVLCYFQWQALAHLKRENKTLLTRLQEAKSTADADYNKKFSLLDTDANLLRNQVKELPKLRNQVQSLRKATNEITKLLAENQKLKASLPHPTTNAVIKPISYVIPTNSSPGVFMAKENWTFSGYATPEAALQSALWAMRQGDLKSITNSFSPEMLAELKQDLEGKSEAQLLDEMKGGTAKASGYRIERQEQISSDITKMHIQLEGEGPEEITLIKFGNEWKIHEP